MNVKKIYRKQRALVSDELINASDAEIDAAIYDAQIGMVIYNADLSISKQKALDGRWVPISNKSGESGSGGSGIDIATDMEVDSMISDVFS